MGKCNITLITINLTWLLCKACKCVMIWIKAIKWCHKKVIFPYPMSLTLNQSLNLYLTWNLDWYLHPDPKWRPWLQNSTPAIPCNDIIACLSYFRTLMGSCFRIGFTNVISIRLILLITSGAQQTRVRVCVRVRVRVSVRVIWIFWSSAILVVCVWVWGKCVCVCVFWIFLQSRPGAKSTNLQSISFLSITEFTHTDYLQEI